MSLRQIVELPLYIERTDRFAVFKIDNPTSVGVARNGACADLSRCQKGEQSSNNPRREYRLPFHQVILVTTKAGAGVMIDVVLDKGDAAGPAQGGQRRLEQLVTSHVIGNEIAQMQTFRR